MTPPPHFSIKGLISQRRPRWESSLSHDVGPDASFSTASNTQQLQREFHRHRYDTSTTAGRSSPLHELAPPAPRQERRTSWLSLGRKNRQPSLPAMVFRGDDLHDINNPLPPPPSSSTISRKPLSQHSPLKSAHTATYSSSLNIPISPPPRPASNPSRGSQHFDGAMAPPPPPLQLQQQRRPTLERRTASLQRRVSDPGPEDETPGKQRISIRQSKEWSSDIEKLIRETELAFQADEHDDFRLTSPDITVSGPEQRRSADSPPNSLSERRLRPTPARLSTNHRNKDLPPAPRSAEPASLSTRSQTQPSVSPNSIQQTQAPPPLPPVHSATQPLPPQPSTRPRRKTKKSERSHAWQGMGSKWNLPEGFSDILSGQRFKKIEVDEMLTPDRLEKMKREREEAERQEAQPPKSQHANDSDDGQASRPSADSSDSAGSPQSSASAGVKGTPNSSVNGDDEAANKTSAKELEVDGHSGSTGGHPDAKAEDAECDDASQGVFLEDCSDAEDDDVQSSASPSKDAAQTNSQNNSGSLGSPAQRSTDSASSSNPSLASAKSDGSKPRPMGIRRKSRADDLKPEENDEYFYLKSTPYTLTKPSFKHGPIAFSKAEIGKGARTMDETLDWSAFQMAILGGAGEFGAPSQVDDGDDRFADDVAAWFDSLGFESHGDLVGPEPPSPRGSTLSSAGSSLSNSDIELPLSCAQGYSSGEDEDYEDDDDDDDDQAYQQNQPSYPYDTVKFMTNRSMRRLASSDSKHSLHGAAGAVTDRAEVRPLVVGESGHGGDIDESEADRVQMGCNMNQDLGDFLRWEAQHMHGGGLM